MISIRQIGSKTWNSIKGLETDSTLSVTFCCQHLYYTLAYEALKLIGVAEIHYVTSIIIIRKIYHLVMMRYCNGF